jgi:hypothetical protein
MPGVEKQRIPTHVSSTPYGNPTTADILGDVPLYYTTDAQGNLIPAKPSQIVNAGGALMPNSIDLRNIGNGAFIYAGNHFYDLADGNGVIEVFDIKSLLAGPGLSITEDDKTITINTEWKYIHFPLNTIIGMPDTIEANALLYADYTGNFHWIPHGNIGYGLIWNGSGYDWFDWSCARDICYPWPNGTTVLEGFDHGVRVYGEICLYGRDGQLTDVCIYGDDSSLIVDAGSIVIPHGTLADRITCRVGALYYNLTSRTLQIGTADGWRDLSYTEKPEANVIYVGKNGNDDNFGTSPEEQLLTIGAACNLAQSLLAAQLVDAFTVSIKVFAGTYTETDSVTIPDGVTLIGDHLGSVVIRNASNASDVVIMGTASKLSDVTVVGPDLTGDILDPVTSGWAVRALGSAKLTNCRINAGAGFYADYEDIEIRDCHFSSSCGIGIKASAQATIRAYSTSFDNCGAAILATDGGYIVCYGCSATYGDYALWADGANGDGIPSRIEGNWFTFNYVGAGCGPILPATRGGSAVSNKSKYKNETGDPVKGIVTFAPVNEDGMLTQYQQLQVNMGALLPLLLLKKRK